MPINFSAPLWAALLPVLWLKERASPMRWAVLASPSGPAAKLT